MHKATPGAGPKSLRQIAEEHSDPRHFPGQPGEYDTGAGVPKKSEAAPQRYNDQAEVPMVNHPMGGRQAPFRVGSK
jgi:hypothetical protein